MNVQPTATTPYAQGLDAGVAYCQAAANDDMDKPPFPDGSEDAEEWRRGFNDGVEIWEERWS